MRFLKSVAAGLAVIERSLVVVFLGGMVLLAFLQVVLRNFFSSGILWADPLLRHAVLWIGFLGASLATGSEKHINLDIVSRLVSSRVSNAAHIVTTLFAAAVTAFLAHAGWTFVRDEMASADTLVTIGERALPAWWFQLIIPIGFGLMAFRFLLRSAEHVGDAFRPPPQAPPSMNVPTIDV